MSTKKILIVGNFLSETSSTRSFCEDLANRLEYSGWTVTTASRHRDRVVRLVDMVQVAVRQCERYDVAQVDVFSGLAFLWAEAVCWVLRRLHKPYILTLHGGNLPRFAGRWRGRVRTLFQSAAAITTPSRFLLEQMQPFRADMNLLPNPLDLKRYEFRVRQSVKPNLVWLRAFHELYNPSLAADAVSILNRSFPDTRLVMIGPDKQDGTLEAFQTRVRQLGIADQITVVGGVPNKDVPVWLDKGDIFLNTANTDNTPISVMEAMACGLCVVSTNIGGIPYLLEDGRDALLVPPADPEAMVNAITRIMANPELAEQLSRNARAKVEQFDWSVILPRWEHLLISVANSHR